MSILIVDDSADHSALLADVLHRAGYRDTEAVQSVEAAYRYLGVGTAPGQGHPVDVVLLDIMMPVIDGLEACRTIKTDVRLSDLPVIMVTAVTDSESLRKAFAAGATDYIRKPIIPVEVVARVCTVLTMKVEMDMRKRRERELESALQEVKALRGCAPICASCKRIRGPAGRWQSLEEFVKAHSELKVDDTLCHYCVDEWRRRGEAA